MVELLASEPAHEKAAQVLLLYVVHSDEGDDELADLLEKLWRGAPEADEEEAQPASPTMRAALSRLCGLRHGVYGLAATLS